VQAHAETLKRIQEDRDVQRQRLGDSVSPEHVAMDVISTDAAAAAISDADDSVPSVTETTLQVV